jgi:hypothetical protein
LFGVSDTADLGYLAPQLRCRHLCHSQEDNHENKIEDPHRAGRVKFDIHRNEAQEEAGEKTRELYPEER